MIIRVKKSECIASAIFVMALCSLPAFSQDLLREQLVACKAIDDDAARLICLDSVLLGLDPGEALPAPAEPPSVALPANSPDQIGDSEGMHRPVSAQAEKAPVAVPIVTATRSNATAAVEETTGADKLGKKYLPREPEPDLQLEESVYQFQLLNAYRDRKDRWTFEFENGQVWRQTEARYLPRPGALPSAVTISEGVFGSYDLRADYISKSVKVKRIR